VKQSIIRVIVMAAALGLGSGVAQAQSAGGKAGANTAAGNAGGDSAFVKEAAMGGMAEVELGRLALQKGESSDVKQFAQRMVDDHSKANDQLKPIAQQKNVAVPSQLSGKEKALYDRLSKLSGAAFDRAYMRAMLADHRKDVTAFTKSTSGKDPDVKQFASQTLPTLQDHLKMAQSTAGATATSGHGAHRASGTSGH